MRMRRSPEVTALPIEATKFCAACVLLALSLGACASEQQDDGSPVAADADGGTVDAATSAEQSGVKLFYFDRVPPPADGPAPIFHQAAISGELKVRNGCLVLQVAERSFALIFERGSASFDEDAQVLIVDGGRHPIDSRVRMGGSGGSAVGEVPQTDIAGQCAVDAVWLVNPGSLSTA